MKYIRKIYILGIHDIDNLKSKDSLEFITKGKKLSLYAQIAVRKLVEHNYDIPFDKISVVKDSYGKPYIKEYPHIFFSIAHTENVIAIGFSNKPIGIDIERNTEQYLKIAKRFFSDLEVQYITECSNPREAFLEIWTKKEAYIKYLGLGLEKPLNSFCVFNEHLKHKFVTLKIGEYTLSFYDGESNKIDYKIFGF